MSDAQGYVLGQSDRAARRLEMQDGQFAEPSERLLDELALRPDDRVVELGCGPGSFSRRILRRLGKDGVVVGVDSSEGLLREAHKALAGTGPARFETVQADIASLGPWLRGATVVVARTVLHHVPLAELLLGRLRAAVPAGTRVGFIEPDFRSLLGRIGYLEVTGRTEVEPLRVWALAINHLYEARRLSPDVGASMARTMELAGYRRVREVWYEGQSDNRTLENMRMFYDEVRDRLQELNILSAQEVERQQALLTHLSPSGLPGVWGSYLVAAET